MKLPTDSIQMSFPYNFKVSKVFLAGISFLLVLVQIACTKIEATTMGGDIIPEVDNVHTFDTFLTVISNNYIPADSTRISQGNDHVVGGITNDPLFGSSKATLFFEMKPASYPFEFTDSVKSLDSAVLILNFRKFYGESSVPLTFNLYEVDRRMQNDTLAQPNYTLQPDLGINRSKFWGTKTMKANQYRDTIALKYGDSVFSNVNNQLRIPLNQTLARMLFEGDSATIYGSDSIFRNYLPGFALEVQGSPMAFHYFSLTSGSGIEFYYQKKNDKVKDTVRTTFTCGFSSAHAVKFDRDRSGAEINSYLTQNPTTGVSQVYIDATPGSMASIVVPGLKTLTNRVLHRAELKVTELEPATGLYAQLSPPKALYLDVEYEKEAGNFRGVPYDLSPFSGYYCYPSSGIDFSYFGGVPEKATIDGSQYNQYTFNITRYIQGLITRNEPFFNFRLSAPYSMYYKDCVNSTSAYQAQIFPFVSNGKFINEIGESRIKVGGGNHPDTRFRMQIRLIYSKL